MKRSSDDAKRTYNSGVDLLEPSMARIGKKPRSGAVGKCRVCGREFYMSPCRIGKPYCSKSCFAIGTKQKTWQEKKSKCVQCGTEYYRRMSASKRSRAKFCSQQCALDHAAQNPKADKGKRVHITRMDAYFSGYIRARDNSCCCRCGKQYEKNSRGLHNSHFIGRANKATRFDPENCDSLCWGCHQYLETRKATDYRDWKIAQLGQEKFDALVERSRVITKRSGEDIAKDVFALLRSIGIGTDGNELRNVPVSLDTRFVPDGPTRLEQQRKKAK